MKLTQPNRSLLAVIFTAIFLITGKIFVWKSPAADEQTDAENEPVAEQQFTETNVTESWTALTEMTTVSETKAFVPIEPHTDSAVYTETLFRPETPDTTTTETTASAAASETTSGGTGTSTTSADTTSATATTTTAPVVRGVPTDAPEGYFDDALFIGDSRTVGLASYAPIDGATYFATVGLSTYKIDKSNSEVPGTKGKTFDQVLKAKKYTKVYIMLGINELGMDFNKTIENFEKLIDRVQDAQPDAIIYLMANLHVDAARSQRDGVVNNTKINTFNGLLQELADNDEIFYLDVNPIFDDANGCLTAEYTSDGTHPYAKHYPDWTDWIKSHAVIK